MAKAKSVKKVAKSSVAKVNGDSRTIKVLAESNPKRGNSARRFSLYRSGQTVQAYIDKVVAAGTPARVAKADIAWDLQRKFIAVQ
jgi:hypothetical protein